MEEEVAIWENLQDKHHIEWKDLETSMSDKWEEILKWLIKEARDEGLVQTLLQRAKDELGDALLRLAEEKE